MIYFGTSKIAAVLIDPDENMVFEQHSMQTDAYIKNSDPAIREQNVEKIQHTLYSCVGYLMRI